jgi:hypothetical protein
VLHARFPRWQLVPPRGLSGASAAAFLAAAVLSAPSVQAEPGRPFELSWQAPTTCPTSGDVEREIARLIGDASRHRATVRASAEVTGRADDWRVQIRIQDGEHVSERSFDGATCRAVTKVASLIIALAIEPNAGATPEPASPLPRDQPQPARLPLGRPDEPAEPSLRGFVAAGPVAELRLVPHLGVGFEIALGMRLPSFSAEVRGGALLPQDAAVPNAAAGGRFSVITAGLRVCARIVAQTPEIFGCAAALLDRVQGEGYGVTTPGSATALLGTTALGPRIDLPLGKALRLSMAADATYTFSEASFRLDNVGNVHRTPRWGGSARVHLAWLF